MFCAPEHVFGGAECVGSRFHVFRTRLIFGGPEGDESRFHILCSRTSFRQYRGRWVPFSCFALPNTFLAERIASGPVFFFYVPVLVSGGTEGVGSRFQILRPRTHFQRYRETRVPFSSFAHPDSFSAVPRASGPIFMFCAPGNVFGDSEGVGSRFHVLRSRTRFQRYRGRRVPFSCFAHPNSFSTVPMVHDPVFMFCGPGHVFGGAECVGSRFLFFSCPFPFSRSTEGVGSRFNVLRSRTRFRRY
jgi:hypothetical protein